MAEMMSLEQKRAAAIATARLRLQQSEPQEQPLINDTVKNAAMAAVNAGPLAPFNLSRMSGEVVDKAAYHAGGAVTDLTGSPAAGYATNVAIQAAPTILSGNLAKQAAPTLDASARRLMQSAIKPSQTARDSGVAERAIDTMLQRGISPTAGGLAETQANISKLENVIQKTLDMSPASVNKFEVAKQLKDAVKQVNLNLDRAKNVDDIQDAFSKFWNHAAIQSLDDMPVALANRMKQAFYKELSERAYQPGVSLTAFDKAQKALARGLRLQVGKAEPAVVPMLDEQSKLIDVAKTLQPQVSREGNKNIMGIGSISPTLENALIWMLDRSPWAKGVLARGLYAGQEQIPATAARAGMAGILSTQGRDR